ncbi:HET-domain-containing protein [Mollisia scopiformis]|uniref:HET-domain-containing protein n=1 Tax=Mollisia scopiformis TaxID=149040 RepID=A0A194WYF3_MOLSC|nr:HET-domain-containing protein [Mollisia scopiformis]KUJ12714.1 HET-domain-containing protein [Mollisia scopiformis]
MHLEWTFDSVRLMKKDWKPTRLLKVSEDPDSIRLCEKDEIPHGTVYTTLSHCWGAVVLGTLLTTNIESLKKSIPLSSLVKTFQNAVEVTRQLKVGYIWIDCLCIIQDSRDDWKFESMRMEAVYGHSYCNIAATASADGRGGLFRERDPKMIEPCTVNMSTSVKGQKTDYRISDFSIWWKHFEASPLNVRAWVMQERLLSPRVLQFDRDQLLWECNELTACERHPGGMDSLMPKDSIVRRFRLPPKKVKGARGVLDLWAPVLRIYSATRITKDTDRLVALYGVAMKVQRLLNCDYQAGL